MSRLPEVGALVGVKVHEWNAHLASKVEELGAGVLGIAHPSDGRSEYDLPKGITVDIEWVTPRGLMRVRGQSGGPRPGDALRVLLIELAGDPQVFQRRDYVRASAAVDVVVTSRFGGEPIKGITLDVSGGGVQARLPGLSADVDTRLELELMLPEERSIVAEARVTRRATAEQYSLVFEQIEPKEQERLIRFVFQRLRGGAGKAA
jgi:c-di-GMP-binding flagellar brake protein YcgR